MFCSMCLVWQKTRKIVDHMAAKHADVKLGEADMRKYCAKLFKKATILTPLHMKVARLKTIRAFIESKMLPENPWSIQMHLCEFDENEYSQ